MPLDPELGLNTFEKRSYDRLWRMPIFEFRGKPIVRSKPGQAVKKGLDRIDGLLFALPVFYFYYHYILGFL